MLTAAGASRTAHQERRRAALATPTVNGIHETRSRDWSMREQAEACRQWQEDCEHAKWRPPGRRGSPGGVHCLAVVHGLREPAVWQTPDVVAAGR